MDCCRIWNFSSKTLMLAAVCACVFDLHPAFVAGQEASFTSFEASAEDLVDVDSGDIQVAPSPKKKGTASLSKTQKKRSSSKAVRKINVPATLGATKSLRKSEAELDNIFAARSVKNSNYVQYGPSAVVASQESHPVGAFNVDSKTSETVSDSKSRVTNAPYVERSSSVVQTAALTPDMIEPTVPERYPLFEEDALTQESAPLGDDVDNLTSENDSTANDGLKSHSRRVDKNVDVQKPSIKVNPLVQEAPIASLDKTSDHWSTSSEKSRDESATPFASPWSNVSNSSPRAVMPTVAFKDRFTRYSGLFADFEWLGWQTNSISRSYAFSASENDRSYEELSLRPSGSGYRGRAGLRMFNGWDLTGAYTKFDADKSGSVKSDSGNLYDSFGNAVDKINADADVKLNVYDVEVGRWITREQWAVRPFAGVRWTQLDQTQNVGLRNDADRSQVAEESCFVTFDDMGSRILESQEIAERRSVWTRSKADMYGVRLGAEGSVALFRNLSAYGRSAATISVGDVSWQTATSSSNDESNAAIRAKKSCATPSLEAAVGLAWRRGGLEVKGGYEFNVWSNASSLNGKSSDFATRGLFAGIAWNN